jgi:cytochrome o ubiquinol oxidase subunit 3
MTATDRREAPYQSDEKSLGFWTYLMTDAIIFALLFATYVVMLGGTAGGPAGKDLFSLPHTFGETMLLLVSSTTFGFASLASRAGNRRAVVLWLLLTALLGLGFVGMEISEFVGMIAAASCRPSSRWSAPTASMSASG